jgi:hypothetical protein
MLALTVAVAVLLPAAASAAPAAAGPYILPERMEHSLQEFGLTWAGRNHAVLSAICEGQGFPGPKRVGEWGIKTVTYRKFLCMVTVRKAKSLDLVHVETLPGNRWTWEKV